jgi:hypothetical protein
MRISSSDSGPAAEDRFAALHEALNAPGWEDSFEKAEHLADGSSDPALLYVMGVFCSRLSDVAYSSRNYGQGSAEENGARIQAGLDMASKSKDYLYNASDMAGSGIDSASGKADAELFYVKFLCEVRLRNLADAHVTLKYLGNSDKQGFLEAYASMVYAVEADAKDAPAMLAPMLEKTEMNAFYYLARHLALHARLGDAKATLLALGKKADALGSAPLLKKITECEDAGIA